MYQDTEDSCKKFDIADGRLPRKTIKFKILEIIFI